MVNKNLHTFYIETQIKILRIRLNRIEKQADITEAERLLRYNESSTELFEIEKEIDLRKEKNVTSNR